ncbi:MAG TPA: sulfotransferase [Rhodanobacteraceae bacterium]
MPSPDPATTPTASTPPLSSAAEARLAEGLSELDRGNSRAALQCLTQVLAICPEHVATLRWAGIAAQQAQDHALAQTYFRKALGIRPDDADLHLLLGITLGNLGNTDAAIEAFTHACQLDANLLWAWYNLGEALQRQAHTASAITALHRALEIDATCLPAQTSLARALISAGAIDEAIARLRATLQQDPANGNAWWSLANLRTVPLDRHDADQLEKLLQRTDLPPAERILLGFSHGRALEDQHDYVAAFAAFSTANALQRRRISWPAAVEHKRIKAIRQIFSQPQECASDPGQGHEVIFIASLPRSGSTLIEQILASHPDVEGANEIEDLGKVISGQARLRQRPFPLWIPGTTASDWQQLGADYLARTARWREHKPRCTDKGLMNWMFAGTALAMLPAAKVVIVRRDPVETCLACFRHWFDVGITFSCNLDEMADRCIDFWHLSRFWLQQFPQQVFDLEYETLLREPEATIRRLLDFCELPFDAACLDFHRTQRTILSSPSAAQVRQPLRRDTARAAHYGDRLDGLRQRLRAGGLPVTLP